MKKKPISDRGPASAKASKKKAAKAKAAPPPMIVVDYGQALPAWDKIGGEEVKTSLTPGTVIRDYKPHNIEAAGGGESWIECDAGFIFVGETGRGCIEDPALLSVGGWRPNLARLRARLPRLRGYTYGRSVAFPESVIAPAKLKNTGTRQLDCSSFTWCALSWIYNAGSEASWYKAHQLIDTPNPWAAIEAAGRYLCAKKIGQGIPKRDGVFFVQTWNGDPYSMRSGHQFIAVGSSNGQNWQILQASGHPKAKSVPTWGYDYKPAVSVYCGQDVKTTLSYDYAMYAELAETDADGALR